MTVRRGCAGLTTAVAKGLDLSVDGDRHPALDPQRALIANALLRRLNPARSVARTWSPQYQKDRPELYRDTQGQQCATHGIRGLPAAT